MSEMNDSEDFATLLAQLEAERAEPQVGEKVKGEIVAFGDEVAFVDLGSKAEAVIDLAELTDEEGKFVAEIGDEVEAVVAGTDDSGSLVLRIRAGHGQVSTAELKLAYEQGLPVEGLVQEAVKGGVQVEVGGMRAFCPVSQLDRDYVEDPAVFEGQRMNFRIIRFEDKGRHSNIVVSRRALLEEEAERQAEEVRKKLEVGAVLRGTVRSVMSYGAFVDLGGLEGLLHVSEMGYIRVEDPNDVVSEGQSLEVKVIDIRPGEKPGQKERISLSLKALQKDPWDDVASRFPAGTEVDGIAKRLETFGAFVEVTPGIDGLLHISELGGDQRVRHARDVLELGQPLRVIVASVDAEKRRISLRLAAKKAAEDEAEKDLRDYLDEQKTTKVDTGQGGGFGSMGDFFKKSRDEG